MKLFKNNTMTLITDLRNIGPEINNTDFVAIACVDGLSDFKNHPNAYDASILLPPTELLMAWADGNQIAMRVEYPKYLACDKDADDMIIALITALTKKNIIIYIPQDEYDIFGPILIQHIYFQYGIVMNTPTTAFSFDESKLPLLISKFYMMDLMEPMDYINSYPRALVLPPFVINKLATDLHPFENATFEQYAEYFNKMVAQKSLGEETVIRRI